MTDCSFCQDQPPVDGGLVYARRVPGEFLPATPGHTLIIPRRHVEHWFDMNPEEQDETFLALEVESGNLRVEDPTIAGFNIGMNIGAAAGQTVFHAHTHLIPRRVGDVKDPRWGIARALILERHS